MTRDLFALSFGFVVLIAATTMAQAATCGDHATIVRALADRYGETRRAIGLSGGNAVIEIFASDETGTWTIALTRAGGPTCLVASGEGFEALAEAPPPRGRAS